MNHFRSAVSLLVLAAFSVAGAAAQTTTTGNTATRTFTFPPVGLASSETAQINVVNLAEASSSGTAASCTGTVSFVNGSGQTIGSATSFTVGSGQISSATLPFSQMGASGSRAELLGKVTLTYTSGSGVPCALASSLETYETSTGATHVYLSNGADGIHGFGYGH